ncbi:MAG TPA: hypothetical protein VN622_08430 [Clostridia bacterium]|nr:hypothetical protein [Clostridia bacterium]
MKNVIAIFVFLFAVAASGCHRASHSESQPQVVDIEQVVARPQSYAHKVVTVHACFVSSFERVALLPCQGADLDYSIWVEDAEMLHAMQETSLPAMPQAVPDELRTAPKAGFVFRYDEAKIRAAWNKLRPENSPNPYRAEVVVVGQFETVEPRRPEVLKNGFGHMNMYAHELILVDVLAVSPLSGTTQKSSESTPPSGEPVGEGDVARIPMQTGVACMGNAAPMHSNRAQCVQDFQLGTGYREPATGEKKMVGTGRFELPTPRTPTEGAPLTAVSPRLLSNAM